MGKPYEKAIRDRILDVLSDEPIVSIKEVAEKAKTQRITAKKHLERLTREGIALELRKGSARLFMLRTEGDS
jgi:predicted ArsR family transcriptional regulator